MKHALRAAWPRIALRLTALALSLPLLLTGALLRTVHAAGIVVTSLADTMATDGQCTLREAITNANDNAATHADCAAGAGADAITFAMSGTITVTSVPPEIIDPSGLTMSGAGRSVTLNGSNSFQLFRVGPGATLNLDSITLTQGFAGAANQLLGGDQGGAIRNDGGIVTITNTTISRSRASSISNPLGGAVFNGGTMTIAASTLSENDGGRAGGAIFNDRGVLTLVNSTISGNQARGGGGIQNDGTLYIYSSTISGNRNTGDHGGGIRNDATLSMANSILAGNSGSGIGPDCLGPLHATGPNLLGNLFGCTITGPAPTTGDAGLGAFGNYGGVTNTYPVQPGSQALDAGDDSICAANPTNGVDQRGVVRPQGSHCDLGSFERRSAEPIGINGDFEAGSSGWTLTGSIDFAGDIGIARIETEGDCFGANNTMGIAFNGLHALNVRSSPRAPLDSVGIATSAPFTLGQAVSFRALAENDDAVPSADPVSFEVRILDGSGGILATHTVRPNILTTSPGTTNDGCLVGEWRDGEWSQHSLDTSAYARQVGRVEFRQHTNVPGKGFFTLIDDVIALP